MSGSILDRIANPTVANINPLDAYSKALGVNSALNENKLFQARQAAGEAYQQATDPNTGVVDPAKAQALIAADPRAALMAQLSATSGQDLRTRQLAFNNDQQTQIASAFGSLLSQPDSAQTPENYQRVIAERHANGTLDDSHYNSAMSALQQAGNDPQALRNLGTRLIVGALGGPDMARTLLPTSGSVNQGGQITPVVTNSPVSGHAPGAVQTAPGALPTQLTPADLATQVVGPPDANGQPTYETLGARLARQHAQIPGAPGSAGGTFPNGGRNPPPALLNPNKPPASGVSTPPGQTIPMPAPASTPGPASTPPATPVGAPSPTPPAPSAGGVAVPAGNPPGTAEEMQGSVSHAVAARDLANTYQQRIQPMEGALATLAGADTGRASETLNTVRANVQDLAPAFLQRMLPTNLTDPAKRAAFEEANKYLTAMQINAPGGARSDAGQAAAGAATPNVHIGNVAATQVVRAMLAQQRMAQAGTLAFNQSGLPATAYDRFMNNWNTNADPRAFVADKMSPTERSDLVKGMGGVGTPAYQKFRQSYDNGVATGVIASHVGQ